MSEGGGAPAGEGRRRLVQLRRIACEGFVRDDGFIDVEATLVDTRPAPLALPQRTVPAGQPVHHMTLCFTVDGDRVIRDVRARMLGTPYDTCSEVVPAYRELVGMRIEPGFVERARRLFRRTAGCSHMTELIPVLATAAFQTAWGDVHALAAPATGVATPIGGCHALRLEGPVVQTHFRHLLPPRSDDA